MAAAGLWALAAAPSVARAASVRFGDVVGVPGQDLAACAGRRFEHLALLACAAAACHPIPFQIDERDVAGVWALDQGPEPNAAASPGVLAAGDLLLFMASDAGARARRSDLPGPSPVIEISVTDAVSASTRWVYLVAFAADAPRSDVSYVRYDPSTDRVRGGRVTLGFRNGVPDYLAIAADAAGAEVNLLDRLKVRASATLLWGLLRFARSEADLSTQFVAWRQGPIRVIRRQRQWVRLGWGIRSPTFGSYTYFYRDFAELPVSLGLNFPPTYFFGNILVRVILDFRDLRGWSLVTASVPAPIAIDGAMTTQKAALNDLSDTWFAVRGPDLTLLQTLQLSPSLATVRRRFFYRENHDKPEPPESVPGEEPGIGYRLDQWEHVGAGTHQLAATSYALPPDVDPREFVAARHAPLQVKAVPLP